MRTPCFCFLSFFLPQALKNTPPRRNFAPDGWGFRNTYFISLFEGLELAARILTSTVQRRGNMQDFRGIALPFKQARNSCQPPWSGNIMKERARVFRSVRSMCLTPNTSFQCCHAASSKQVCLCAFILKNDTTIHFCCQKKHKSNFQTKISIFEQTHMCVSWNAHVCFLKDTSKFGLVDYRFRFPGHIHRSSDLLTIDFWGSRQRPFSKHTSKFRLVDMFFCRTCWFSSWTHIAVWHSEHPLLAGTLRQLAGASEIRILSAFCNPWSSTRSFAVAEHFSAKTTACLCLWEVPVFVRRAVFSLYASWEMKKANVCRCVLFRTPHVNVVMLLLRSNSSLVHVILKNDTTIHFCCQKKHKSNFQTKISIFEQTHMCVSWNAHVCFLKDTSKFGLVDYRFRFPGHIHRSSDLLTIDFWGSRQRPFSKHTSKFRLVDMFFCRTCWFSSWTHIAVWHSEHPLLAGTLRQLAGASEIRILSAFLRAWSSPRASSRVQYKEGETRRTSEEEHLLSNKRETAVSPLEAVTLWKKRKSAL